MLTALSRTFRNARGGIRTVLLMVLFIWPMICNAEIGLAATEFEVKAAFLLNFSKFVEWPANSGDRGATVCILGQDPFGEVVDNLANAKKPTPLIVRLKQSNNLVGCALLFISSSEEANVDSIIENTRGQPVLTVSDIPNFTTRGGMIGLLVVDGKVRFKVAAKEATNSGLTVSSKLLSLAKSWQE